MKVAILGSCASRDAMDLADPADFQLSDYTARTSLASLATEPQKSPALLDKITSRFQRRMVERDMTKAFWMRLQNIDFDVLILDFIDDRFDLRLFANQAGHTASAEYAKASRNHELPAYCSLGPRDSERLLLWQDGFDRLIDELKQLGKLDRLVVNCVFWVPDGDAKAAQQANAHLSDLYARAALVLPETHFVRYPDGMLQSDVHHKWGSAAFHYDKAVYDHLLATIKSRLGTVPTD